MDWVRRRRSGDTCLFRLIGIFHIGNFCFWVTFLKQLLIRNFALDFVEICNVYVGKTVIKAAQRIFNSDKMCRSYIDLNFGVTFLEHSVDNRSLANTTIRYVRVAMSGCVQLRYNLSKNISFWTTLIQPCSSIAFSITTPGRRGGGFVRTQRTPPPWIRRCIRPIGLVIVESNTAP